MIEVLDLNDVTLVGFSMGGGEVARFIGKYGEDRLHSVVFAASVTPMMFKTDDNPDGPLDKAHADKMAAGLSEDQDTFYDTFMKEFFSKDGDAVTMMVSEEQRQEALMLCKQADKTAALAAMQSFATTDFRQDLTKVTVPTLVIHGDADGTVPYEGSGRRTHAAVAQSELLAIEGGPHGINVSHTDEFNTALLAFLEK